MSTPPFYGPEPGRSRAARMPKRVLDVVQAIAERHEVHLYDLLSDSRDRRFCAARQDAYLALSETPYGDRKPSLPMIGKWFGRDHTSVLHGVRRASERHAA